MTQPSLLQTSGSAIFAPGSDPRRYRTRQPVSPWLWAVPGWWSAKVASSPTPDAIERRVRLALRKTELQPLGVAYRAPASPADYRAPIRFGEELDPRRETNIMRRS